MSRKEFNNCPVTYCHNDNCSSNKSCAPINACSREGIYSLLIVIALIAILVAFYFVFNYLFY
ncbi:MAG: hypothetical protein MJ224_06540 [archaeon]|nr:hypothetical protein [archaeon]